jgi:hypothetical protein
MQPSVSIRWGDPIMPDTGADTLTSFSVNRLSDRFKIIFLGSGLIFLIAALVLFLLTGYLAYRISNYAPVTEILHSNTSGSPGLGVTQDDLFRVGATLFQIFLPVVICFMTALLCSFVGVRILRASGVATTQVIAPQDYELLGKAVSEGNDKAIDLWVRLSSLSGYTGTFTKVGLTGLPLATIVLTLLLAACGLFNEQFFDLAKLTLGAFLGSYVQRQNNVEAGRTVARQAAEETVKSLAPK